MFTAATVIGLFLRLFFRKKGYFLNFSVLLSASKITILLLCFNLIVGLVWIHIMQGECVFYLTYNRTIIYFYFNLSEEFKSQVAW